MTFVQSSHSLDYPALSALTDIASSTATLPEDSLAGTFLSNIFSRITTWLADAGNGLETIVAKVFRAEVVYAREVHAEEKICVDDQCLTKEDIRKLLLVANAESAGATGGADESSVPVIEIQGNNPAHVPEDSQYNDLGAIITGPSENDTNLGLKLYVDGERVATVQIDTSEAGEHTIDYVATNGNGTATSTRTVIVDSTSSPQVEVADTTEVTTTGSATSTPESTTTEPTVGDESGAGTSATSTDLVSGSETTTTEEPSSEPTSETTTSTPAENEPQGAGTESATSTPSTP